jgi:GDPmannose 4,6-dehydratase
VDALIGDFSKAKKDLGWEPSVRAPELVEIMWTPTSSSWATSG